jgi:hypothetical protein
MISMPDSGKVERSIRRIEMQMMLPGQILLGEQDLALGLDLDLELIRPEDLLGLLRLLKLSLNGSNSLGQRRGRGWTRFGICLVVGR